MSSSNISVRIFGLDIHDVQQMQEFPLDAIPESTKFNTIPCGGQDNEYDGCGRIFPLMEIPATVCKDSPPLCSKCRKLGAPGITADEATVIENSYKQCILCGITGSRMSSPCGTCMRLAHRDTGSLDPQRAAAADHRRHMADGMFYKHSGRPQAAPGFVIPPSLPSTRSSTSYSQPFTQHTPLGDSGSQSASVYSTGPMTSAEELLAHRQMTSQRYPLNVRPIPQMTVHFECRRSNAPRSCDQSLGKHCRSFSEEMTMLQLTDEMLAAINVAWTSVHPMKLRAEDIELRGPCNLVLPPNDFLRTIREWYDFYNSHPERERYIVVPPGMAKKGSVAKLSTLMLEIYIHIDKYRSRIGETEGVQPSLGRKRRGRTVSSEDGPSSKRHCSGSVGKARPLISQLKTTFMPDDIHSFKPGSSPNAYLHIQFKRTTCECDEKTGQPFVVESEDLEDGRIAADPLELPVRDRGRTKDVFMFYIEKSKVAFVAKKLVNTGRGRENPPTLPQANRILQEELIRVHRLAYFANLFHELAETNGVDLADFSVTEAFIIKVYTCGSVTPSTSASSDKPVEDGDFPSQDSNDNTEEFSAVYLVEPKRMTTVVQKFSGTLGTTSRRDQQAITMAAFAHFVIEFSRCYYMIADIQGSHGQSKEGNLSLILFDPMTHTPAGKSGLGDHGAEGFEDFFNTHECNTICNALSLLPASELKHEFETLYAAIAVEEEY